MPDRISFTRPAVERIASVVRAVENARPGGAGLRSRAVVEGGGGQKIKLAAFTGTSVWVRMDVRQIYFFSTDTASTAVLPITVSTSQTATAIASMFSIPGVTSSATMATALITVAKLGGIWHVQAAAGGA